MSASDYPMTDFQEFLTKTELIESSRRQVVLAMRRALKHLGPEHLCDLDELMLYRLSMPEATRRLFGYAWSKFQPYMESIGEPIPDLPKMPSFKVVHPLWADLTDLSIHLNVNMIEAMRWRDVPAAMEPDFVERPARRAFEFITGRQPLEIDWLVPRNASADGPMPFWMIDTILRTNTTERNKEAEKAAFNLLQSATRRGIKAADLKSLWAAVTESFGTTAGRRRMVRVDALEIDSNEAWGAEDQKLVMSVLGGATLNQIPDSKKLDISGAIVPLREALNRVGSGATLDGQHATVSE